MKLNLALDATYSVGADLSGVGNYSRELLHGLVEGHPEKTFRWLYRPHRWRTAFRTPKPANVQRGILWDSLGTRKGLFHGLNQRLPKRRFQIQVATFHDLFVLTGEYSTPEFRVRFAEQARHAASEADCIIAVSQFTADQVHELLHVDRNRIRVIHHGVVPRPLADVPRENLVLSVGAIQDRKNTARLLRAFRAMPNNWQLVLAGSTGFGAEKLLSQANLERVHITGYVSEWELTQLYSRASVFVFPSLDEGFGMPILEAMLAEIPVITSNRSAMPEVAGNAAVLIDPENEQELASQLCRLALSSTDRYSLVQKGLVQAGKFSWEKAAQETWSVYQELTSLLRPQSSGLSGIAGLER